MTTLRSTNSDTGSINTSEDETKKTVLICDVRQIYEEYFLLKSKHVNIHHQTIDKDWQP